MPGFELREYVTKDGRSPFAEWLRGLKDIPGRERIRTRLDRASLGNLGDHETVGAGVFELRMHFGPGYRVYFGKEASDILVLLLGGTKRTQRRDIWKARKYWADCGARRDGN